MEKEDAVRALMSMGYNAELKHGVVDIILPSDSVYSKEYNKIIKALAKIGYKASYGVRKASKEDGVLDQK